MFAASLDGITSKTRLARTAQDQVIPAQPVRPLIDAGAELPISHTINSSP